MPKERVQRKLAAILAADVAGYSRLMAEDEEGTLAALTAHRTELIDSCIADHGGRIFNTAGDGLLAEFGSVVDAVRCAVALQEGMAARNADILDARRIAFRIGVNLGDIIIQDDGLYGDGVNVAARLEGLAVPGSICVSGSVHEQVRQKLTYRFEDLGRIEVKNIAEPVHVFRLLPSGDRAASPRRRLPTGRMTAAAAVLLIAIAAGSGWWSMQTHAPKPISPAEPSAAQSRTASIAILPFINMGGDQEQEYFSDGITEDLITDLSKISGLTVISRTSTSGYKGRKIDIREVGEVLGVRYVVEGSVRKAGSKVRINAQLVDAATGGHLWAERYDGDLKNIFGLQDRVLEKIVGSLALTLSEKERRRLAARGTDNVVAHDLYLRGLFEEAKFSREANREAVRLYEQALSIDPDYPLPYARISNILQLNARNGWSDDVEGDLKKAVRLAEKAVSLDGQNPSLHWGLGRAVLRIKAPDAVKRGIKSMERAIALDPDFADAYAFLGHFYSTDGRIQDGLRSIETAMRMNPRFPFWYLFLRGINRFMAEDYEDAIADFERAAGRSPTAQFVRWWLAASYAQMGQQGDAEWQVDELASMGFDGSIATIIETWPNFPAPFTKRYTEAMRKAGIPE